MTDDIRVHSAQGPHTNRAEFCERFVTQMMKALPIFDGTEDELREYAEEAATTYWDDTRMRAEGPEECARTDISYWEEG